VPHAGGVKRIARIRMSNDQRLIVVSGDSHAEPPAEVWSDYLERQYHEFLPQAVEDNDLFVDMKRSLGESAERSLDVFDTEGAWRSGGYNGAQGDLERRLAEMDREGIAAELVYWGDTRAMHPLYPSFRMLAPDVVAAGARMYHRWLADVFGVASDRLLLVGDPGCAVDLEAMLKELTWTADQGFRGAYLPGFLDRPDLPPIYDPYYEPFWSACEEMNIALVCHAGYGSDAGGVGRMLALADGDRKEAGRKRLAEFNDPDHDVFLDLGLKARRAMWRLMLSGVFDRHPNLILMMSEVRGDWLPGTLRELDAAFESSPDRVPARRRPSDYWHTNGFVSLSFIKKAEVPMLDEIGIDRVTFGRDYPHPEGTWPNTQEWLRDAFDGFDDEQLPLVLGENAVRILKLDRTPLARIASRIGPTRAEIAQAQVPVSPGMIQHWHERGGYLKAAEEIDHEGMNDAVQEDIELVRSASSGEIGRR
jgi:predicted TIM-barrel fold metal-dependent hydrolase